MFSRKKPEEPKRRNHDLSQFGLMEIPDDFDVSAGDDDAGGDSDLEAELAVIVGGGGKSKPMAKPKATLVPSSDLDRMIADSLKDVGSDDDDDGDAENDPDLLGELHTITGGDDVLAEEIGEISEGTDAEPTQTFLPTTTVDTAGIIQQRIEMYRIAEGNAKATGESAKARRFGRGLKTLTDLLKQAKAGHIINVDDIPPEVIVKPPVNPMGEDNTTPESQDAPSVPSRPAPLPPPQAAPLPDTSTAESPTTEVSAGAAADNPMVEQMRTRQREYKAAALQAKRSGNTSSALMFLKVVKQFDMVIKMCEDGQEVDLSDMPPPPEQFMEFMAQMQAAPEAPAAPATVTTVPIAEPELVNAGETSTPATMLEALQQRLDKYKTVEDAAKAEGNSSKARRFGRIVKQYEEAIKLHKAGQPLVYEELPVPPGFGPLPGEASTAPATGAPISPTSPPTQPSPSTSLTSANDTVPAASPTGTGGTSVRQELTTRTSGNQQKNNLAEQQMKILLDRQREFKQAAIDAKKSGELDQAKEYLKIFKGFDALLNAASSGLPVDLNTLPLPPSQRENLEASFAIVTTDECDPNEDLSDIGVRVEEQLAKQLMMCKNTRDHHKAMGDVAGMNRFENLALTVQKDLDLVRYSKRKNFPLPKFHYEKRSFNIVHCNTDLTDSELEIVVVRGINYKVANPKDVDTYVKIEFPLLNDESFKAKTTLIKDTDSPDYDQRFKVEIQRGNRQFQRIFKRHGVKFEVFSRGGFLRSDILIGTVTVKLQPLETKCDIHDTFDLMEGRKAIGGKLEIKLSVRNPILTKQIEHINEKWLVIDT